MAKKDFKASINNPAMNFISIGSTEAAEEEKKPVEDLSRQEEQQTVNRQEAQQIPEGYKLNPLYLEKKTRRVQLLLKPSVYNKIKTLADNKGISVNDLISTIVEDYKGN